MYSVVCTDNNLNNYVDKGLEHCSVNVPRKKNLRCLTRMEKLQATDRRVGCHNNIFSTCAACQVNASDSATD